MDIKKTKVSSIILMEVLNEELSKVIENEIDKGESGDYVMVDLLIELVEVMGVACEVFGKEIKLSFGKYEVKTLYYRESYLREEKLMIQGLS